MRWDPNYVPNFEVAKLQIQHFLFLSASVRSSERWDFHSWTWGMVNSVSYIYNIYAYSLCILFHFPRGSHLRLINDIEGAQYFGSLWNLDFHVSKYNGNYPSERRRFDVDTTLFGRQQCNVPTLKQRRVPTLVYMLVNSLICFFSHYLIPNPPANIPILLYVSDGRGWFHSNRSTRVSTDRRRSTPT